MYVCICKKNAVIFMQIYSCNFFKLLYLVVAVPFFVSLKSLLILWITACRGLLHLFFLRLKSSLQDVQLILNLMTIKYVFEDLF